VRVTSSIRDFSSCILASIETSLGVLIETESQIHAERNARIAFQWLFADSVSRRPNHDPTVDSAEAEAVREVTRLSLVASRPQDRAKALAALVYALTEHDVVSDSEAYGLVDDRFVFASLLRDESLAQDVSPAVASWCRTIVNRIDGMAARASQSDILARFTHLASRFESLCVTPEPPSLDLDSGHESTVA
jgi:hypothetical protein